MIFPAHAPRLYENLIAEGKLKPDPQQRQVAEKLAALSEGLSHHPPNGRGIFSRLLGRNDAGASPKGAYIWGDVGRGKTMLMDMFFESAPVEQKRRMHFHAFMQDVHARIADVRRSARPDDAIGQVASAIGSEAHLLCLDEMQISDITDAMIVGRLFEALFNQISVIVTTSNSPPEELYKDGLNRQLFVPFIRLIEDHLDIIELPSPHDYRLGRVKGYETFITPLGLDADRNLQALWQRLTDTETGTAVWLDVNGRKLAVPQAARGCARFTFAELCEAPLGPADYLALARNFRVIFVENIPVIDAQQRNAAKRLTILIDTLYDARTRFVASSEAPPNGIFHGADHGFEFARTVSRLEEMQSASWWGGKIVET